MNDTKQANQKPASEIALEHFQAILESARKAADAIQLAPDSDAARQAMGRLRAARDALGKA